MISAQYVDGLEFRIKELIAQNHELALDRDGWRHKAENMEKLYWEVRGSNALYLVKWLHREFTHLNRKLSKDEQL